VFFHSPGGTGEKLLKTRKINRGVSRWILVAGKGKYAA